MPGASVVTRKLSIPSVNPGTMTSAVEASRFLDAVKQNLDVICGRGSGVAELDQLPGNATTAQIIATLNAIIMRLNSSGS
jgi:hypothetical protein